MSSEMFLMSSTTTGAESSRLLLKRTHWAPGKMGRGSVRARAGGMRRASQAKARGSGSRGQRCRRGEGEGADEAVRVGVGAAEVGVGGGEGGEAVADGGVLGHLEGGGAGEDGGVVVGVAEGDGRARLRLEAPVRDADADGEAAALAGILIVQRLEGGQGELEAQESSGQRQGMAWNGVSSVALALALAAVLDRMGVAKAQRNCGRFWQGREWQQGDWELTLWNPCNRIIRS